MYLQQYEVSMTILDYFYPRLKNYIDFDISDLKIPDKVYYPVLMEILQENEDQASVKDALKLRTLSFRLTDAV